MALDLHKKIAASAVMFTHSADSLIFVRILASFFFTSNNSPFKCMIFYSLGFKILQHHQIILDIIVVCDKISELLNM